MDLTDVIDFADQADKEIGKYRVDFSISPALLTSNTYPIPALNWQSIKYGEAEIDQVPADRRGVYAFSICHPSAVLPPHGYVLYIGIAGRKSDRSLNSRYRDYLSKSSLLKRARIARMIANWHEVLRFNFAPVENSVTSEQLEELEAQLNTAMLPPFSEGDLQADIKMKRRAFR
ncbi:MAG: hypothetical protein ACOY9J_00670 [Pseudomonadota bacterium]